MLFYLKTLKGCNGFKEVIKVVDVEKVVNEFLTTTTFSTFTTTTTIST
jgi:hypothetical protein